MFDLIAVTARYGHSYGTMDWVADIIVRGLIYRAVWAVTRGMTTAEVLGLALVAVLVLIVWRRA